MGNEWISPVEITTPTLCGSHGKQVWKRIGKCVEVLDTQSCPTVCDPMNCSLPGSSIHGILQVRILKWLPFPSPGDLHDPGIEPRSPTLQVDSLLFELSGKPTVKWLFC